MPIGGRYTTAGDTSAAGPCLTTPLLFDLLCLPVLVASASESCSHHGRLLSQPDWKREGAAGHNSGRAVGRTPADARSPACGSLRLR